MSAESMTGFAEENGEIWLPRTEETEEEVVVLLGAAVVVVVVVVVAGEVADALFTAAAAAEALLCICFFFRLSLFELIDIEIACVSVRALRSVCV